MKICIIGAGASGILLSLLLHQAGMTDFCLIDPHFDGGALQREWPTVISNTPWSAATAAIQSYLPSFTLPQWSKELPPDQPTTLRTLAKLLHDLYTPLKFSTVRGYVQQATWKPQDSAWTLYVQSGTGITEVNCRRVLFAQGSIPKQYDIPVPSIPLEVALDAGRLPTYVSPTDRIVIFGTNHSGIVALKNLAEAGIKDIVGVYKGPQPFIWARDGEYDGLKLDGAATADLIMAGGMPAVRLVSYNNTTDMMKVVRQATWVIFAAGFTARTDIRISIDDDTAPKSIVEYDATTGTLTSVPNAWGFGIAYPSQAPDGVHFDVGISSFLEHFNKQIPAIVAGL